MVFFRSSNRRFFLQGSAASAALLATTGPSLARTVSANAEIRLAYLSCGGRANELMGAFEKIPAVKVVGVCDPDPSRVGKAKERFPDAKTASDLRTLIDDKNIDAVVVATCNHWHCLAAIWAMQAGKDVYVEKPLSHTQWEGEQTVAAARKYARICQVGTQQRSDPMQAQIKKFLHDEQGIGKLIHVRVNRYGVRGPIGKRNEPLPKDPAIDFNLWLGPAADKPVFRNSWHYDWHWDWNTGSGEMGNWGVHVLDDVRNVVFRDSVAVPRRILGGGGRVLWEDAGETPNVHVVAFDTGTLPVVIGLSNLTSAPDNNKSPKVPGPSSGYIVVGEGGRLEGQRGSARAYDNNGKLIQEFKGNSGSGHQANFVDAVLQRDPKILNAEVQVGHDSTGWCNFANICFQVGEHRRLRESVEAAQGFPGWTSLIEETRDHLHAHGIGPDHPSLVMSPWLELDPEKGRFRGEYADQANALLRRTYRAPFVVPETV
ncbi:MAG: Gfo/Idh/MocA family protein [Planctomycetota bacterium]|jgi:predicted dehydrogenase